MIRSQAPDVTVLIGSGDSKQKFKCYKVMLSFASEYLDAMLSSSMKEGEMNVIEFPDKDPEEWKLFYQFITPQLQSSAVISADNVMILLPWFHEFGIDAYVKECDVFLSQKYLCVDELEFWDKDQQSGESEEDHQTRLAARKSKFDAILGVLSLANMYSLPLTKTEMERRVAELLNMLPRTHDLFDIASVKSLLQGLPFELVNETGLTISEGESDHLLPACEEILLPYVSNLSQDIIDNEIYFPHLFYSYLQIKLEKERAAAIDASSGVGILRAIIEDVPNYLYQEMPQHDGGRVDRLARIKLREVISKEHKENLQNLGITLPVGYP